MSSQPLLLITADNFTVQGQIAIQLEINDFIIQAAKFGGYAANDYVKFVLTYKNIPSINGEPTDVPAPDTLDLYFADEATITKFYQNSDKLRKLSNGDYVLMCNYGVALIKVMLIAGTPVVNFNVDHPTFDGTYFKSMYARLPGDDKSIDLEKAIVNKEATMYSSYAESIRDNGNVNALRQLLKQGYTIKLPNGFKFAGDPALIDPQKFLDDR